MSEILNIILDKEEIDLYEFIIQQIFPSKTVYILLYKKDLRALLKCVDNNLKHKINYIYNKNKKYLKKLKDNDMILLFYRVYYNEKYHAYQYLLINQKDIKSLIDSGMIRDQLFYFDKHYFYTFNDKIPIIQESDD